MIAFFADKHLSDRSPGDDFQRWEYASRTTQDYLYKQGVRIIGLLGDTLDTLEAGNSEILGAYYDFLANMHQMFQVIYVEGNHDPMSNIVDITKEFAGGERYQPVRYANTYILKNPEDYGLELRSRFPVGLLHGHQFDSQISRFPRIAAVVGQVGGWLERRGFPNVDRWFSQAMHKLGQTGRYSRGRSFDRTARQYAQDLQWKTIICGHTHHNLTYNDGSILYLNPGSWTNELGCPGCYLFRPDRIEYLIADYSKFRKTPEIIRAYTPK